MVYPGLHECKTSSLPTELYLLPQGCLQDGEGGAPSLFSTLWQPPSYTSAVWDVLSMLLYWSMNEAAPRPKRAGTLKAEGVPTDSDGRRRECFLRRAVEHLKISLEKHTASRPPDYCSE